ncbi:TRY3 [Symbiodinium sp. CCMP2456]|nr:TRY3 [Symbiodinium sp. CCMP2456]
MKFGKSIGSQQEGHADLHYVEYKLLKKKIKDVVGRLQASELAEALTANTVFEEELAAEIGRVNQCFSQNQHDLLDRTAQLAEELHQRKGCSDEGGGVAFSRADAMRQLVDILQEVDQLRKYAVWNAVAVVKILKKRRKQTSFGIEDTAAERAGWLSRQGFFSGSDFAELHASVESLGHMLVLSEILPEDAGYEHAAYRSQSNQEPQQCPICLDTISDMVELSCKHRFCWKCFVLGPIAFQPGEYRITQCPICRRETQLEESDEAAAGSLHSWQPASMSCRVACLVSNYVSSSAPLPS